VLIIEPARVVHPGSEDEFNTLREVLISIRKVKLRSLEIYLEQDEHKDLIKAPQLIQDSYLNSYLESPEARALKFEFDRVMDRINEITSDPSLILNIPIIGTDREAFGLFEGVYDTQQGLLEQLDETGQAFWNRPFMDIYKQLDGMPVLEGASHPEAVPSLIPGAAEIAIEDSLTGISLDYIISEAPKVLDLLPKGKSVMHVLAEDMRKVCTVIIRDMKDAELSNNIVTYISFWLDSGYEFNLLEV
jgi:hypothetical protein